MDLLITVSNEKSADILLPLLRACIRRDFSWRVFMTDEGVKVLEDSQVSQLMQSHKSNAVVCQDSWQRYCDDQVCLATAGSQTNHSQMAAIVTRVISL